MGDMKKALVVGIVALCAPLNGVCLVSHSMGAGRPQPEDAVPMSPRFDAVAEGFGGVKSETRPSRDATMSFTFASEVRDVLVKGGQRVKKDDVLMRARDSEVVAALEQQKSLADSGLEIEGSRWAMELAEFRFEQLKRGGSFTPSEFEELRIQAETSRVQHRIAEFNREQQQLRLKQLEAQAERYRLVAPFDGVVSQVFVDAGQAVNEQQKALRIVNTDQLWLDAWFGTDETMRANVHEGGRAWVLVDVPDRPVMVEGRVIEVDPVADPVSQTRRIRVEIQNTAAWPAGTQARVRISGPPAGGNWAVQPGAEGGAGAGGAGSAALRLPPLIKLPESFDLGRALTADEESQL